MHSSNNSDEVCDVPILPKGIECSLQDLLLYLQTGNSSGFEAGESKQHTALSSRPWLLAWMRLSAERMRGVIASAKDEFKRTSTTAVVGISSFGLSAPPHAIDHKQTNGSGSLHDYAHLVTSVLRSSSAGEQELQLYSDFLKLRLLCLVAVYCARMRSCQTGGLYASCIPWLSLVPAVVLERLCESKLTRFRIPAVVGEQPPTLTMLHEEEAAWSADAWRAARHVCQAASWWLSVSVVNDLYMCFLRKLLSSDIIETLRDNVGTRAFAPLLAAVDGVLAAPDSIEAIDVLARHVEADGVLQSVHWCVDHLYMGFHVGIACALRAITLHYRAAVTDEENQNFVWRSLNTQASRLIVCGGRDKSVVSVEDLREQGRVLVSALISYVRFVIEDLETVQLVS